MDYSDKLQMQPSVTLISLPWTSLTEPNLGLGILRSVLDLERIPCRVLHLNLFLLEHLQARTYYALANVYALNDFLFSGVLDPDVSLAQRQWLNLKVDDLLSFNIIDERSYGGKEGVIDQILKLRQEVIPSWLAHWADKIADSDATLIGSSCMFDQTISSLALAYLIKQRAPTKLIALGGYAVRPPTGNAILQSFSFVDVICIGEGEPVIAQLARASTGEIPIENVPNVLYRQSPQTICVTTMAADVDMNHVPVPNYDDFFADLTELSSTQKVEIEPDLLPIENSRGCWWGQKKHCVFCGIHKNDLAYRARDSERVLEVMDTLSARYGMRSFRFSDYILPLSYYRTLLPELVQRGRPYKITSEMKANVNSEQFALLANAGFEEVQPGIESFSSSVLRKMDKGVTSAQNIFVIMLGKLHNVTVRYNLIYGLPDETAQEVENMVRLLPRLFHLEPPSTRLRIQVTRYAPLQVNPDRFGIPEAMYEPSYDLIFSEKFLEHTGFDLNAFCYYFDRSFESSPRLNSLYSKIEELVDAWKNQPTDREVALIYQDGPTGIQVFDSRSHPLKRISLTPIESSVYRLAARPISLEALRRLLSITERELRKVLERLDQLDLIFTDEDQVIGLALPMDPEEFPSLSKTPEISRELLVPSRTVC